MNDLPFSLTQLQYFVAAAELGGMTAASQQLNISQSAVSTAIAGLERSLGVQLLLRHHARGLTLTPGGEQFLSAVRDFLRRGADLAELVRDTSTELRGELAIGCFATLAPFRLAPLLSAFARQNPQVRMTVHEAEHQGVKEMLRSGTVEVALMYGYDLEKDVEATIIDRLPPYVIVPNTHRLASRRAVRLGDLASEPMVLLDLPSSAGYLTSVLTGAGVRPDVRYRSTSYETVRSMVSEGLGYAVLNQRPPSSSTYSGGSVTALRVIDPVQPLEVVVARMAGARSTRRAQAFHTSCLPVRRRTGRPEGTG